jgi:hypothetical protein
MQRTMIQGRCHELKKHVSKYNSVRLLHLMSQTSISVSYPHHTYVSLNLNPHGLICVAALCWGHQI